MRRKVKFACLTGQTAPGCNILTLKSAVVLGEKLTASTFYEGIVHRLVEKVLREYPNSDLNAILGLTIIGFHDGVTRSLMAYGNPARIQRVEGLKGETCFDYYDVEI